MYQGLASFSGNTHRVNTYGLAGHIISVTSIQLGHCSMKTAIDNTWTNEHQCVNKTLFTLLNEAAGSSREQGDRTIWEITISQNYKDFLTLICTTGRSIYIT